MRSVPMRHNPRPGIPLCVTIARDMVPLVDNENREIATRGKFLRKNSSGKSGTDDE